MRVGPVSGNRKKEMDLKDTEGKVSNNQGQMRAEAEGGRETRPQGNGPALQPVAPTSFHSAEGAGQIPNRQHQCPPSHLTFGPFCIYG